MKIVIDDKIPYIREAIGKVCQEVVYIKGADICPNDLKDADALIVRTRTRCNEQLLGDSTVRFVATATIGIDHMDTEWMDKRGIRWVNCPGCNAGSVAQYVEASMEHLRRDKKTIEWGNTTIGIVGCGHVGERVKAVFEQLGARVMVNDPPAGRPHYVDMDTLAEEADIISFHVPLEMRGPYATYHMADRRFFSKLKRREGSWIINTSRGGVVDENALLEAMDDGRVRGAIIDTWENEPHIDERLLERAYIATPHIAGYSADGKVAADNMVMRELCRFFNLRYPGDIKAPELPCGMPKGEDILDWYDPMADTERLRANPELFEELRGNYPIRRERN